MFKKCIFLSLSLFTISSFSLAMDKNEQRTQEMKAIKCWTDVAHFAGKVVLYTANKYCFTDASYPIESNLVGYIPNSPISCWEGGETGYDMARLLRKDACPTVCALVNSKIEEMGTIKMREANSSERKKILDAIDSKEAKFAYMNSEKIRELLNQ